MGSKKKVTVGYKYYLGMQMAICHGPIDSIRNIAVDDRIAWEGDQPGGRLYIDKPGLFGGDEREGGIQGYVDIELGGPTQGQNSYLVSKLGSLIPAFRGIVGAVLNACYMGTSAYMKPWSFRVQRIHKRQNGIAQWYDSKAEIGYGQGVMPLVLHTIPAQAAVPTYPGQIHYTMTAGGNLRVEDVTGGTVTAAANYSLRARIYDMAGNLLNTYTYTSPKLPVQTYLPSLYYDTAEVFWIRGLTNTFGQLTWGAGNTDITAINAPLAKYVGISPLLDLSALSPGTHSIVGHPVNNPRYPTWDYYSFAQVYSYASARPVAYGSYFYIVTYDPGVSGWLAKYTLDGTLVKSISLTAVPRSIAVDEYGTLWITDSSKLYSYDQDLVLGGSYTLPAGVSAYIWCGHVVSRGHILMARNTQELVLYRIDNTGLTPVGTPIPYPDNSYGYIAPLGNGLAFCRGMIIQMVSWTGTRDMNPAHIIRECLTDPTWGMGYPDADIDDTSFMAAADALYAEGMGMSMLWDRQIPLEDFVKEVLKHITGVLYVDRTSGKFVLKLVRGGYDPLTLLTLDESNVERVDNYKVTALGELVNSVTVKFWDWTTGKDAAVTLDELALQQVQGCVINSTVDYSGFTNRELASRVAARVLKSLSTPLVSCTIYASRVASSLNVGDVFNLTWPDYNVTAMPMRVTAIALGDGRNNRVKITCTQDVYALPDAVIAAPAETAWVDPSAEPSPPTMQMAIEAPYYEVIQRKGEEETAAELTAHPERGYLLVACNRPASGSPIYATVSVDAGAGYAEVGKTDFCPSATLAADVTPSAIVLSVANGVDLNLVEVGTHGQIDDEIVRVDAVDTAAMTVTVGRGCLDTCPRAHLAGASMLFWDVYALGDDTEYAASESPLAMVQPTTGLGTLSEADAIISTTTMNYRAIRPYAPGQFKINSAYFPDTLVGNLGLTITWAHRDRLQQTAGTILDHTAASVGPEAGVTYNVYLYKETGVLGKTFTGLTGTSLSYAIATEITDMGISGRQNGSMRVVVEAERSGYKSYQVQDWTFKRVGYGFQYGNYYGGK